MKLKSVVATLIIAMVLIAGLVGCGKADRTKLDLVDSLLAVDSAHSATKILKTFDPNDLTSENNAYYALLYTQVQYKCYEPIESDSLISIAVRYYTDNFDQRKLTCALMYRGAVYADLNFKRLALDSYNEAEQIADTTDWKTLGLLNFRIGELHHNSYIENSEPIERYKKAANYFRLAHNEVFEHYSYGYLGKMYITENYDSAYYYINKTIDWAIEQGDQEPLLNASRVDLSKLYWHYGVNLDKRKELLFNVYCDRDLIVVGSDILNHLVDTYCKLGMIDSAKYYAAQFAQPEQLVDSMSYHMMLESLAIAQGDYKTAYNSNLIATKVADKILMQGKAEEYYAIDKQYDNNVANAKVERLNNEKNTQQLIIIIVILLLTIVIVGSWLYMKRKRKAAISQQLTIDNLQNEIKNQQYSSQKELDEHIQLVQGLNYTIDQKKELEQTLRSIAEDRVKIMSQLLSIKYQCGSNSDKFVKQINDAVLLNKKSRKESQDLIDMANQLYGNIIEHFNNKSTDLNFNEQLLLALVCMEFGAIETKMVLDLASIEAVYTTRSRLARKLGVANLCETVREVKQNLIQK